MKKNTLKSWIFGISGMILMSFSPAQAQLYASADFDSKYEMLMSNPGVQIEAT